MKKLFIFLAAIVAAMTVSAEVLLDETVVFGTKWDTYRVINLSNAPCLANVQVGDIFTITVTAVDTESEGGSQLAIQSSSWVNLDEGFGLGFTEVGVYPFVLTEAAVAQVKEGGIIVKGINNTISKVELLYQKTLWTGELGGNDGWIESNPLDKQIFSDLKEGDILSLECTNLTDTLSNEWGHACVLRYNYEYNIIDKWTNAAGTYHKVLSADDVTKLQEEGKNINLVARWLVITSLNTYLENKQDPGSATAIDNTNANANTSKIIRNGRILILRDNKTYNVMGQVE